MTGTSDHRLGKEDFEQIILAVKSAVAELVASQATAPALLDQPAAIRYTGLSRSSWYRLKSADLLPTAVAVGDLLRRRKVDLDQWVSRLGKPRRRTRRVGE